MIQWLKALTEWLVFFSKSAKMDSMSKKGCERGASLWLLAALPLLWLVGCQKDCLGGHKLPPQATLWLQQEQVSTADPNWRAQVHAAVERFLDSPLVLRVGTATEKTTYRKAGFYVDEAAVAEQVQTNRTPGWRIPIPVEVHVAQARVFLQQLKLQHDTMASAAVINLQEKTVLPSQQGFLLDVWESLLDLQDHAERLRRSMVQAGPVALTGQDETPPAGKELTKDDLAEVLGMYQTRYSPERDRTFNLQLGAGKIAGTVLAPGEVLSFNQVVGPRTIQNGFRVAAGYREGEIVDDVGGGACQLASTLHAAAFFAGLDFTTYRSHSRPSTYIPMGLDATVVYDSKVDLGIRNPYDFPVIIQFEVKEGLATAKIYGRKRPQRVIFEREVLEQDLPDGTRGKEVPFVVDIRMDPLVPETQTPLLSAPPSTGVPGAASAAAAPVDPKQPVCIADLPDGQKRRCLLDQVGYPGYKVRIRRYSFQGDPPVGAKPFLQFTQQTDPLSILQFFGETHFSQGITAAASTKTLERVFAYPPTREVKRIGTGSIKLKPVPAPHTHPIRPLRAVERDELYHLVQ